ncbi:ferredoxin reductase-like protein [Ascobolus immersus RN42]|uniref:NADH-cytochrome b5 reductase n=1 Tax=Ascobolus immersus RN42 TaxID=1160509 RepID=A0A3N4ICD1_ASCIM|nr:ferredoxin reductase-like protein [Ascobolus immersus RN42]
MAALSKLSTLTPFAVLIIGACIVKPSSIFLVVPFCLLLYAWKIYSMRIIPVLKNNSVQRYPLEEKLVLNHNVAIYRFKLPTARHVLGLPIGNHISVRGDGNGKEIWRSYTPITSDKDFGHFSLLVKSYPAGNVSKWFAAMQLGDLIEIKGPKGNFNYRAGMVGRLGMIAGGTGITPMLQIIRAIVENPNDLTEVALVYANVTFDDILLKDEIDELAEKHDQIKVYYVLNSPPENWNGGVGFVSREMIENFIPKPASDTKLLICGPPPMVSAMKKLSNSLGFEAARPVSRLTDQVFCF